MKKLETLLKLIDEPNIDVRNLSELFAKNLVGRTGYNNVQCAPPGNESCTETSCSPTG